MNNRRVTLKRKNGRKPPVSWVTDHWLLLILYVEKLILISIRWDYKPR